MDSAKRIGRLGALAFALGVSAATATAPAIAHAGPGDSPGDSSQSAAARSAPANSPTAGEHGAPDDVADQATSAGSRISLGHNASEGASDSAATDARSPIESGDIEAGGDGETGNGDGDGGGDGDIGGGGSSGSEAGGGDGDIEAGDVPPASGQANTPVTSPVGTAAGPRARVGLRDGSPGTAPQPDEFADAGDAPSPDAGVLDESVEPESAPQPTAQLDTTEPGPHPVDTPLFPKVDVRQDISVDLSAPPVVLAPDSLDLADAVVSVFSGVLAAALAPLLDALPGDPVSPSPALLTMLAWTRRDAVDPGQDVLNTIGTVVTGVTTFVERMFSIYDFNDWRGWLAFGIDYTWGLPGTLLGDAVQVINAFVPGSNYRDDLSYHQNHHVYEGGVYVMGALSMGNVISNAGIGDASITESTLAHEDTHVWESRLFGPLFQITYVSWFVGGALVGTASWLTNQSQDWYSLVYKSAYYDNPWERWARASE